MPLWHHNPSTSSALCHSCPLSSIYLSRWMPAGPLTSLPCCPHSSPFQVPNPRGLLSPSAYTLAPTQENLWPRLLPSSYPAVLATIQMLLRGGGRGEWTCASPRTSTPVRLSFPVCLLGSLCPPYRLPLARCTSPDLGQVGVPRECFYQWHLVRAQGRRQLALLLFS